jgi:hypothetical protein
VAPLKASALARRTALNFARVSHLNLGHDWLLTATQKMGTHLWMETAAAACHFERSAQESGDGDHLGDLNASRGRAAGLKMDGCNREVEQQKHEDRVHIT